MGLPNEEKREYLCSGLEVRETGTENEPGKMTIGGFAVRYNQPTLIRDCWGDEWLEEIAPGAFDESLQGSERRENEKKALWNHDQGKPLGSTVAGTLRFLDNQEGLEYETDLPGNTWGKDAFESVKRRDVTGSSFGFICCENHWDKVEYQGKMMDKRTIMKADLIEVSPCTFPAYNSSEIDCRSRKEYIEAQKKGSNTEHREKLEVEKLRTEILLKL